MLAKRAILEYVTRSRSSSRLNSFFSSSSSPLPSRCIRDSFSLRGSVVISDKARVGARAEESSLGGRCTVITRPTTVSAAAAAGAAGRSFDLSLFLSPSVRMCARTTSCVYRFVDARYLLSPFHLPFSPPSSRPFLLLPLMLQPSVERLIILVHRVYIRSHHPLFSATPRLTLFSRLL